MNYSKEINDIFDPLIGMTKKESTRYLKENEDSIKDELLAGLILFLGAEKEIYKKTPITIFNQVKIKLNRWYKTPKIKVIDSVFLGSLKKQMQGIYTKAKEFNQQVLKQEHLIDRYNKDDEVILLWYVLNEKTQNHCPYCVENNRVKIYTISNAPELPQKEGHGGVGYGCFCFYKPITSKSDITYYASIDKDLTFRKDWWNDKHIKHLFDDDLSNGELPD